MSKEIEVVRKLQHCGVQEHREALEQVEKILLEYEAIKKELGCPLKVVVKALKNGIYYPNGNHSKVSLHYYNVTKQFGLKDDMIINHLKDYKKTWWLKADRSE